MSDSSGKDGFSLFGDPEAVQTLTRREREVLTAVLSGLKNREIARVLGISLDTTKEHLGNIYRKMGESGRAGVMGRLGDGGNAGRRV